MCQITALCTTNSLPRTAESPVKSKNLKIRAWQKFPTMIALSVYFEAVGLFLLNLVRDSSFMSLSLLVSEFWKFC